MDDPPAAAVKPCCVCAAPGGKHCTVTEGESRHYCSKACQLFKAEPAVVADVAPARGSEPAVRTAGAVDFAAPNDDVPDWRGTCAICLDLLPLGSLTFYDCCAKKFCRECSSKCVLNDDRCPLCRRPGHTSDTEWVQRVQQHADEGNAEAQLQLGDMYRKGDMGLEKSSRMAFELHQSAALRGHAGAQFTLGLSYEVGDGVQIDSAAASILILRAAEQGYPLA